MSAVAFNGSVQDAPRGQVPSYQRLIGYRSGRRAWGRPLHPPSVRLIAGFAIVSGVVVLVGAFTLSSVRDEISSTFRPATPA